MGEWRAVSTVPEDVGGAANVPSLFTSHIVHGRRSSRSQRRSAAEAGTLELVKCLGCQLLAAQHPRSWTP